MDHPRLIAALQPFFPNVFDENSGFLTTSDGKLLLDRLARMADDPIHLTNFNQLLHLNHEAGVTEGFFRYYFQAEPREHPYPVDKITDDVPILHEKGVASIEQMQWGIRRFFVDSLLYWDNIRDAYRELRVKSFDEIEQLFESKRFPSEQMRHRGKMLPLREIPIDDRYLISEMACKAYSPGAAEDTTMIEEVLVEEYQKRGQRRVRVADLFAAGSVLAQEDPNKQMLLELGAEEYMDETVEDEMQLRDLARKVAVRFGKARDAALENTRLYLSIVNELDVYVATSMRRREDFRNMARDCEAIFRTDELRGYSVRYFDPTLSAAVGHEDKGLIECLMVKCAKCVLYFAGERDSFGKDAEIAMAMSLGKPVIILCPGTKSGIQRERFFRDVHPLSRLIEFDSGIPIGAMVTRDRATAARLLSRLFSNTMEYELEHSGDGYFRLKERLTRSVVRLQSNWKLLREAFWNYYHEEPKKVGR